MGYSLAVVFFFQSLLSIITAGFLVTQHIVDIGQIFGYGLLLKMEGKIFVYSEYINITNNFEMKFQEITTYSKL